MTTSNAFAAISRLALCALLALAAIAPARAGETITFFHNDVAGSPAVATDVNGIQAWKETYRPYGDQLIDSSAATNNKLWFTGKSFDDSTRLSYMGARYYDPTLGRFMAVDPVSFQLDNLHSFNRYTYANNNPYKYVDPDGEFAIPLAIRGGMLLLAAGCAVVESCRNAFTNTDWRPLITPLQDPWMWSEEKKQEQSGEASDKEGESSDAADQPPNDSKPISETKWSGDHGEIKKSVLAKPDDKVRVGPNGDIWVQNPDGTWSNRGNAEDVTGSGDAEGRRGKERDSERERRRERIREKRKGSERD